MKTNAFIMSFILLGGCQAKTPPSAAPATVAPSLAATPPPHSIQLRAPEVVKTYTLGAYVDPADPTLRHEAHTVQRIEAAAYWDLRPVMETKPQAPLPLIAQAMPAAMPLPPPQVPLAVTAPPPVPVELVVDPEPAMMPNADGVIDLTAVGESAPEEVNPFSVRAVPAAPTRSIELRVTGILSGARPSAIINGQLLEPGGTVEGLVVKHIEPGGVVLTFGRHRLRVPLSAEPIRVRTAS